MGHLNDKDSPAYRVGVRGTREILCKSGAPADPVIIILKCGIIRQPMTV